jgi:hypothetical protein
MRLVHSAHPEQAVRLAYCLNLHPADDLAGLLDGIERITLPLAERFDARTLSEGFGVGPWIPADLALSLASAAGARDLGRLVELLAAERLDAFTFNAFPYRAFQADGLKTGVFRPTWREPERLAYTLAVARVACAARAASPARGRTSAHASISTHSGMLRADVRGEEDLERCAANLAQAARGLAELERERGLRIVLALEPEPRSLANDTSELPALFERVRARSQDEASVRRHLGACLDTCHAAIEFEEPSAAWRNATRAGNPLGKLQFSSALALRDPAARPRARELLLAMDEPRFLHQVTGRSPAGLVRTLDLRELGAGAARDPRWDACDEWRCHFHVPVDLARVGGAEEGLLTTRDAADRTLAAALADPARWGTDELHVEIETYTWSVLPSVARGTGDLVDGLEREYRHVLAVLERAGWTPERAG